MVPIHIPLFDIFYIVLLGIVYLVLRCMYPDSILETNNHVSQFDREYLGNGHGGVPVNYHYDSKRSFKSDEGFHLHTIHGKAPPQNIASIASSLMEIGNPYRSEFVKCYEKYEISVKVGSENLIEALLFSSISDIKNIEAIDNNNNVVLLKLEKLRFGNVVKESCELINLYDCRTMFIAYKDTLTHLRITSPIQCIIKINF